MFRIISLAAIAIIASVAIVPATIIHIPDDYSRIQLGIDASSAGDTVLVQPGTYNENINFSGHNIVVGSLFLTTGDIDYISQTRIDGGASGSVVRFENSETSTTVLSGFTITNGHAEAGGGIYCNGTEVSITHNIISDNIAFAEDDGWGGGVFCSYSDILLKGNIITANVASGPEGGVGGALYCSNCSPIIKGNIITGNLADWAAGGIYFDFSQAVLSQCVLAYNTAGAWGGAMVCLLSGPIIRNITCYGNMASFGLGGAAYCELSSPAITNSIFWADSAFGIPMEIYYESYIPSVTYCDYQGGWADQGNIELEPFLRDPENGDFHLMATDCDDPYDSPCIDMGRTDILDSLLDCDHGLGTLISDMGAYGGWDSVAVAIDEINPVIPLDFKLSQNYPNPFNAATTISYQLPRGSLVLLEIYDILGRRVAQLENDFRPAGYHQVVWCADNVTSGIYLYKLRAADFMDARQMLIIK